MSWVTLVVGITLFAYGGTLSAEADQEFVSLVGTIWVATSMVMFKIDQHGR